MRVFRSHEGNSVAGSFQSFLVPYSEGMTILDALLYIHKHLDATLAFRYECRSGVCGTCGVMLNGMPVLSCTTKLDEKRSEDSIGPLSNFPVEKDLIVNIQPVLERFQKIKPYLDLIRKTQINRSQAQKSKPFRKCIECGCCIAGSLTVLEKKDTVFDPMQLVKIARYVTDPRDGLNRRAMAQAGGVKQYSSEEAKKLTKICPRGVPIHTAVKLLKGEEY